MARSDAHVWRFVLPVAVTLVTTTAAAASEILPIDPIVRVREGSGSIPIYALPFDFSFGTFPSDPDGPGTDCFVGTDPAGTLVSCLFRNLSGQSISLLDISYAIPTGSGPLVFTIEDLAGFFASRTIDSSLARYSGGGIPSDVCGPTACVDGLFAIDLVGFPDGTTIGLAAQAVPEPASLSLLLTALGLGALHRARRRPH